jgi:hypothetical protein
MKPSELFTVVDYSDYISERTQNFTGREWVFTAVDQWLSNPQGGRIFLIVGAPGSGKSTVAARIVQMARGEAPSDGCPALGSGQLVFYHFCQASRDDTLMPPRFVEALAQALSARYEAFQKAMLAAVARSRNITINVAPSQIIESVESGAQVIGAFIPVHIGDISSRAAFDEVVRKPLEALYSDGFAEQILVIVDSLDEARTFPGQNIMSLLADVSDDALDLPRGVRLLLTSRPDAQVFKRFGPPALDLLEDAPKDSPDVRNYAWEQSGTRAEPRRSELAQQVAAAASGNFLYARFLLEELSRQGGPAEIQDRELPDGLEGMYRLSLDRLVGEDKEKWHGLYAPVLGILAVARERMRSEQIASFTGIALTKVRRALGDLLPFLQEDRKAPSVTAYTYTLYHRSFMEFLLQPDCSRDFWCNPGESHQSIVDYYRKTYEKRWSACDPYGVEHLLDHMFALADPGAETQDQRVFGQLVGQLLEPDFLNARIARLGLLPVQYDFQRARKLAIAAQDRKRLLAMERELVVKTFNSVFSPPAGLMPEFHDADTSWMAWSQADEHPDGTVLMTAKNNVLFMRQEAQAATPPDILLAALHTFLMRDNKNRRLISTDADGGRVYDLEVSNPLRIKTGLDVTAGPDGNSRAVIQHMFWVNNPSSWMVRVLRHNPSWQLLNISEGIFNALADHFVETIRQFQPATPQLEESQRVEARSRTLLKWWNWLSVIYVFVALAGLIVFVFQMPGIVWLGWLIPLLAVMLTAFAYFGGRQLQGRPSNARLAYLAQLWKINLWSAGFFLILSLLMIILL